MCTVKFNTNTILLTPLPNSFVLTRELLEVDGAYAQLRHDEPSVHLLSETERKNSLVQFMKRRPKGDLWIFAYGSLIWNPAMKITDHRIVVVRGWHRSYCLSSIIGRGTPDEPGLMLALERGGYCNGIAYQIAEQDITTELPILWNREMLIGGYEPIWVDIVGENDVKLGTAITFTVDRNHEHYVGVLPQYEKVRRIAAAKGSWGSAAEYLFQTVNGLSVLNIRDIELENLYHLVRSATLEKAA